MRVMMAVTLTMVVAMTSLMARDNEPAERLVEAAAVLSQVMGAPERRIPESLLERAHCVVIVPGLKVAAFVVRGAHGKGPVACRNGQPIGWSSPGSLRIEGGRIGFRIGGSSTDLIMLVMNGAGADRLLDGSFTLGAEGSVAAGPVGRAVVPTHEQTHADILTWSRSDGLITGVALEGVTIHQDLDDNDALYGRRLENREIVATNVRPPAAAGALLAILNRYSLKARAQ